MTSAQSTTSLKWAFQWFSAAAVALAAASNSTSVAAAPAGAPPSRIEEVQRSLARQEYELTWQDHPVDERLAAAWQAPIRAQGMRSYFVQDGIRVMPREEAKPSWVWGLSLAGYGRRTKLWPLEEARRVAAPGRGQGNAVDPIEVATLQPGPGGEDPPLHRVQLKHSSLAEEMRDGHNDR